MLVHQCLDSLYYIECATPPLVDTLKALVEPFWLQGAEVAVAILVGLLIRWIVARVLAVVARGLLSRTGDHARWDAVLRAANPIGTLVMAAALWYALPNLELSDRVAQVYTVAVRVLAACAGVMLAYRVVDVVAMVFANRASKTDTKLDDQLVPLARKGSKIFVAAVGIIFVLQNLNVDVTSLVAGASLGGLAFSFAAKDTVANLFGSVSIFADQPFQVGDYVTIDGHEGVVEEVGMRSTRLRTFDRSVLTVPNSVVANVAIKNFGLREYRRCRVTLGLTYDTTPSQIDAFVAGVKQILEQADKVRDDGQEVHFQGFGDSALEFLLQFFISTLEWGEELSIRHQVFLDIMKLAERVGVSFAFPTQSIHIESMPSLDNQKIAS